MNANSEWNLIRSLEGNRDTEICFGGFQNEFVWSGEPPRGAVHTFRVALWSAHTGGYDPALEDPGSQDCLHYIRRITSGDQPDSLAHQILEQDFSFHISSDGHFLV